MDKIRNGALPLIAACFYVASCGFVGEPLPPALNIPEAVTDLRAEQTGANIEVRFTAPTMTTDGVALRRLGAVELFVNETAVPVEAAEPGPVSVKIPVRLFVGQTANVRVRVASPKGKWSQWSGISLAVVAALEPPAGLTAEATAQGVRLRWRSPAPEFRILRSAGAMAIEVARTRGNEWVDAESKFGQRYTYQVEAVQGEARSGVSAPVEITPQDTFPPAAPGGLTGVAGLGTIELAWDRSPEADTAGYRIYRSADGRQWNQVGDQTPAASYSDHDVTAGAAFEYAVTAVDRLGNESPRSEPVRVAVQ